MTSTVLLLGAGGSAAANVLDSLRRADRDYRAVGAEALARGANLKGRVRIVGDFWIGHRPNPTGDRPESQQFSTGFSIPIS